MYVFHSRPQDEAGVNDSPVVCQSRRTDRAGLCPWRDHHAERITSHGVEHIIQKSHICLGRQMWDFLLGAGDEARTRYLHLGKVALYRMSYTRKWCLRPELNWRHADFQSAALPTELPRHIEASMKLASTSLLATRNRLELSTSSVTGWRANRLHHRAK